MQKVKQRISQKQNTFQDNASNKSPLPVDDQQQFGMNIKYPLYDSQQINMKIGSDYISSVYNQNKQQYEESRKSLANIKNMMRKYSESRKMNPPSRISQQYQSTRATKISDPKISIVDNQGQTFNQFSINFDIKSNNYKQEIKEDVPDVIYCSQVINDKVVKKYKISISEVYIDQPLLVMSFEENTQENQRELKKQNDNLSEILIRSHLGYIQKQQNEFYCLNELNYKELKLNQYLHMNSVFAITQHFYLSKRSKLPLKSNEFTINSLIESIKQIFPQLNVIKDQSLNDQTKGSIKNDQMRIKFIITSILSHIFYQQNNQRQSIIDTPQRLRTSSNQSNCNQLLKQYYFISKKYLPFKISNFYYFFQPIIMLFNLKNLNEIL